MTISDAFAPAAAAVDVRKSPEAVGGKAQAHARMRAQGTSVQRVTNAGKVMWVDLRECWWLPESLPTLGRAWADRFPDRARVPGDSDALYRAWVVYNHTLGLAVPAVALAVVGVLAPLVWVSRHPARLTLALLISTALIAIIVAS